MVKTKEPKQIKKEFSFCSCVFVYYAKAKLLVLTLVKKNTVFFRTTVRNMTKASADYFIKFFTEYNAKELVQYNLSML